MTAGVVRPVVPSNAALRRPTGTDGRREPLPVPPVRPPSDPGSLVFAVATIDCHGRVAESTVLGGLGWGVGTRLSIQVRSGLVLITADPGGVFRMTRTGQLRLPVGARNWCGLTAGHRVLLTADPACGRLVVHPPAAVAAMVGQLHTAVLGGETR